MTTSYPIALKLSGRRCLVVGGDSEADDRARVLTDAGADVRRVPAADYDKSQLAGVWLAVLTERNTEVAERLTRDCAERQIFSCAVDQPAYGSFTHLAIARAGALFAAIGTGGRAPALARRLRQLLQALFDRAALAEHVERLALLREGTPPAERARVLNAAVADVELDGDLRLPDGPTAPPSYASQK